MAEKVLIKQFKNKAKKPVAGLTPEHAIYDANGVRLDAKLGNVNLQEFRDLQQQCVNNIKQQQNTTETYIDNKVVSAKAEIDAKHEEVAQLSQASLVGTTTTGLSGTNVQDNLNDAGEKLSELETQVIYDVTANNDGATFASLSALLSSESLSTLIPISVRNGGMSIRFIQSSDNKYVQYRLLSNIFSTDEGDWDEVGGTVTTTKIADGAVTAAKLADGVIVQDIGLGEQSVMSQKAVSTKLSDLSSKKFDKTNITSEFGASKSKVITQYLSNKLLRDIDDTSAYVDTYKNQSFLNLLTALSGKYISVEGFLSDDKNYNISNPIQLNSNQMLLVKTIANSVAVISLVESETITESSNFTPVCINTDSLKKWFSYKPNANCYVVICSKMASENVIAKIVTNYAERPTISELLENNVSKEEFNAIIKEQNNKFSEKLDKSSIAQELGDSTEKVVSQAVIKAAIEEIEGNILKDKTSIFALNGKESVGNRIIQSTRPYNDKYGVLSYKICTLAVFTDIHGHKDNLQRFIDYTNKYKAYINDTLCLGDMVTDSWKDNMDFWNNVDGTQNILMTIGNHDTCNRDENPVNWSFYAGKEAYDRYFSGNVQNWGVIQPERASEEGYCWYYKDYTVSKVRIIVLDSMFLPKDTDNLQLNWLSNVLSDARDNKLSVVICKHYPIKVVEDTDNNTFNSLDLATYDGNSRSTFIPYLNAVDTFINNGGEFICWLSGDSHYDFQGLVIDYPNQYSITFENAGANDRWNDSSRITGEKSQDSFNFVTFDTNSKLIKVVRIGNNSDRYLRHKNYICYDYKNKKIITCE